MSASKRLAHVLELLLALVVVELLDVDVERARPTGGRRRRSRVWVAGLQVLLAARQRLAQLEHALLLLGGVGVEDLVDLALERLEVALARASSSTQVTIEAAKYRTFSSSLGAMSSR